MELFTDTKPLDTNTSQLKVEISSSKVLSTIAESPLMKKEDPYQIAKGKSYISSFLTHPNYAPLPPLPLELIFGLMPSLGTFFFESLGPETLFGLRPSSPIKPQLGPSKKILKPQNRLYSFLLS